MKTRLLGFCGSPMSDQARWACLPTYLGRSNGRNWIVMRGLSSVPRPAGSSVHQFRTVQENRNRRKSLQESSYAIVNTIPCCSGSDGGLVRPRGRAKPAGPTSTGAVHSSAGPFRPEARCDGSCFGPGVEPLARLSRAAAAGHAASLQAAHCRGGQQRSQKSGRGPGPYRSRPRALPSRSTTRLSWWRRTIRRSATRYFNGCTGLARKNSNHRELS